jgi:hypothetical protein
MVDSFSENNIENVNSSTDIDKEKSPQFDNSNSNNNNNIKKLNVLTITKMQQYNNPEHQKESSVSCLIKNIENGKLKCFSYFSPFFFNRILNEFGN